MINRIFTILIALILLVLLSIVSSPRALGQTPPVSLSPPIDIPASEESAVPVPELPLPAPVSTESTPTPATPHDICKEIHWIVNVRDCQDDGCSDVCGCQFGYEWEDCCGNRGESDIAGFRQWLRPGIPVCVMVHGSFVPEETVYTDCRNTFLWLRGAAPRRELQMVFLSWPSDGIFTLNGEVALSSLVPGLDVAILGRRAEKNGQLLARLVQLLPPESPVCLIGHSHGARIVSSALHLIGGGCQGDVRISDGPSHRLRTILAAAAIDHDWFVSGQRYDHALRATECMLNLRCRHDWALSVYPLRELFSRHALGRGGFSEQDLEELGEDAQRLSELDVTPYTQRGHIWPKYYEHPQLAQSLVPWVYFD